MMVWIVFSIGIFLFGACFGIAAALLTAHTAKSFRGSAHEGKKPAATGSRELTEEERKEISRKQRELFNFMNYEGDEMPKPDEET